MQETRDEMKRRDGVRERMALKLQRKKGILMETFKKGKKYCSLTCKNPAPSSSIVPTVETWSLVNFDGHLSHLGNMSAAIDCL